jgi:hypothetical protein
VKYVYTYYILFRIEVEVKMKNEDILIENKMMRKPR